MDENILEKEIYNSVFRDTKFIDLFLDIVEHLPVDTKTNWNQDEVEDRVGRFLGV